MKIEEQIDNRISQLRHRKWVQGAPRHEDESCLMFDRGPGMTLIPASLSSGALEAIQAALKGYDPAWCQENACLLDPNAVMADILSYIGEGTNRYCALQVPLEDWQDTPGRTAEQVIELLEKARGRAGELGW